MGMIFSSIRKGFATGGGKKGGKYGLRAETKGGCEEKRGGSGSGGFFNTETNKSGRKLKSKGLGEKILVCVYRRIGRIESDGSRCYR